MIVAAVAAVVGAAAVGVIIASTRQGTTNAGSTTTETPATTQPIAAEPVVVAPVGALAVESSGGYVGVGDLGRTAISVASCPGLLAVVYASSCTEMNSADGTYALTLTDLGMSVGVSGYQLVTDGASITAVEQLAGTVMLPDQLGVTVEVDAFRASLAVGPVLGVVATTSGVGDVSSTVELFSAESGALTTAAVLHNGRAELATSDDTIAVVFDRGEGTRLYSTLFPVAGGWKSVTEVLDSSVAQSRLGAAAQIEDAIKVVVATAPIPVETTWPAAENYPDVVTGVIISGYDVPCDGSWITIVGSQPFDQVGEVLASNPSARAVRNEDACASLNPTFSSGSLAGQPIYVIFYGPFISLDEARGTCNQYGYTSKSSCFVAPLTFDVDDRSIRYGPL